MPHFPAVKPILIHAPIPDVEDSVPDPLILTQESRRPLSRQSPPKRCPLPQGGPCFLIWPEERSSRVRLIEFTRTPKLRPAQFLPSASPSGSQETIHLLDLSHRPCPFRISFHRGQSATPGAFRSNHSSIACHNTGGFSRIRPIYPFFSTTF